jgi:hypothetical protein
VSPAAAVFVGKWLEREPWHRLLLLFQPAPDRARIELVEAIGHELRSAALASSDPRVGAGKLGWWAEQMARWPDGGLRHPLLLALAQWPGQRSGRPVEAGALRDWAAAAFDLARDDAPAADLEDLLLPWRAFTSAQAAVCDPGAGGDGRGHALSLLAERMALADQVLARGGLPVPLASLAAHAGSRAGLAADPKLRAAVLRDHAAELQQALAGSIGGSRYRRGQAALARLRLRRIARAGAVAGALPPLRSALAVWRASRGP